MKLNEKQVSILTKTVASVDRGNKFKAFRYKK